MTREEALAKIDEIADAFANCKTARVMMAGKPLTHDIFSKLNGVDRGLESLLGREINSFGMSDEELRSLKCEISEALISTEISLRGEMQAAVECFCELLTKACQVHNTSYENNIQLKTRILDKLKAMDDTSVTNLLQVKLECLIYQYTQAVEFCNIMNSFTEFLDSDNCNLGKIAVLSKTQGGDMTEEDKTFLKELKETFSKSVDRSSIWTIADDRLSNAKLADAGYDKDKLIDLIKLLCKSEDKFFKVVRKFKDALCDDTETTDTMCVKNSEFWYTVDYVLGFIDQMLINRNDLWEQIATIDKAIDFNPETVDNNEPSKTDNNTEKTQNTDEPEKKEDESQKKDNAESQSNSEEPKE